MPDKDDKCPDEPEDFDAASRTPTAAPRTTPTRTASPRRPGRLPQGAGRPRPRPQEKNGCPQFIRHISGSSEIQILKVIEFATGQATILPKSFPILDEVVRLLKVNPEITHLDIEGHTDNRGSDDLNEKLSDDRAKSVRKYLVEHGIEAGRLTAQGFGPKPSHRRQQHQRRPPEEPPRRVPHQGEAARAERQSNPLPSPPAREPED